jgi:hypothetical protein
MVKAEVVRYADQDVLKRADPQLTMGGYCDMVLPSLVRGQTYMAAHLSRHIVSVGSEPAPKVLPRDVSRQLHGAMVSSLTTLTNLSRIASGLAHSSAWHAAASRTLV